jgi:hypothetical protein
VFIIEHPIVVSQQNSSFNGTEDVIVSSMTPTTLESLSAVDDQMTAAMSVLGGTNTLISGDDSRLADRFIKRGYGYIVSKRMFGISRVKRYFVFDNGIFLYYDKMSTIDGVGKTLIRSISKLYECEIIAKVGDMIVRGEYAELTLSFDSTEIRDLWKATIDSYITLLML